MSDERERLLEELKSLACLLDDEHPSRTGAVTDAAAMLSADAERIKSLEEALREIVESTLPGMRIKSSFDAIQRARALLEKDHG